MKKKKTINCHKYLLKQNQQQIVEAEQILRAAKS